MGCCGSKNAVEVNEEKQEENNNEVEEKEEVVELENINDDKAQNEEEKAHNEEENKQEVAVEEEKKEEEIQEDIHVDEEEKVEYQLLSKNFNANPLEKSSDKLKGSMNKSINRKKKSKTNIDKNKPFVILEVQSSPYQKVKIQINACAFKDEYMMPIWCPQDVYIKFRVEGKWRIDKTYDLTDSKGIPSNNCAGFNYGALIGRIGLGEKFMVVDEGTILVKKEGPLYLRQNLPKRMKLEPEGKLILCVYDGICMSIEEINKRIGWIENGTEENNNENDYLEKSTNDKFSYDNIENIPISKSVGSISSKIIIIKNEKELEKKLRTHLNNLRMNPSLFYEKYINFNSSLIWTKKYLAKIKNEEKTSLSENENCYQFLDEYFQLPNQTQFKKNLNKNNVSANLKKLEEDINYFLYDQLNVTVKTKCKITQKDNPNAIIIQFLLDKNFRTYIFDARSQFLTIKTFKNFFLNSTLVVMAIALDKEYSEEEI